MQNPLFQVVLRTIHNFDLNNPKDGGFYTVLIVLIEMSWRMMKKP